MRTFVLAAVALIAITGCSQRSGERMSYPEAHEVDVVDVYHGVEVPDPYRWLEDPDSEETRAWIEAQNRITGEYLAAVPERESLRQRLTELWSFERFTIPKKAGDLYLFRKNDGLQPQSVLLVSESLDGEPRVLLDPNTLSEDGTVSVSSYSPSPDGRWIAYATSSGGSDWREIRIRDVETAADLEDHLRWCKFTEAVWARDSSGFYYNRYDEPDQGSELEQANYFQKIYFHRRGTSQDEDVLVYERPDDKEWTFSTDTTEDGRYLVISMDRGTDPRNLVFYQDLKTEGPVVPLISEIEADYRLVGNDGPVLFFRTTESAPMARLVAIDIRRPDKGSWKELIPESERMLRGVDLVGDLFIASYLDNAFSKVELLGMDGASRGEIELPGLGNATGFDGERSASETFYSFESFNMPETIFHLDLASGVSTPFRAPKLGFDPAAFVTRQVFYASKDGTRVPMFISHKKGLEPNGAMPTILNGYGGFNISRTPRFAVANLVWMELGGIFAVANLRGGGEYGEEWHRQGSLDQKQNTFDDFIAAGEWLIANGYTSSERLSITGASNGGLLVGAVLNQRPDLFAAAIPAVGVMDMLRFPEFTIGWAWVSDYGSPDDSAMFPILYGYSPLHNIQPGTSYPATLVTTADHDDRVVPAHSFKYTAALQAAQAGPRPTLIRIDTRAGHGAGRPTAKLIDEATDRLAFLINELDVELTH